MSEQIKLLCQNCGCNYKPHNKIPIRIIDNEPKLVHLCRLCSDRPKEHLFKDGMWKEEIRDSHNKRGKE